MLNQTGVKTVSGVTRKTILVDELNSTAFSCMVSNAGVSADSEGKKIVKAGTPVKGSLKDRDTAFEVAGSSDTPVGLILHDVDVTSGTKNSQVLVFGFVDLNKVDADVQSLITPVESALKMIQFVK